MMNQLQIAESQEQIFNFGALPVRTFVYRGEVFFIAKDVCKVLQINNVSDAMGRLDEDEKGIVLTDTLGGNQQMLTVNESGLYSLIMGSRKQEARVFRKWVTSEVLPNIRRTGSYSLPVVNEREQLLATMKLAFMHDEELGQVKEKVSSVEHEVQAIRQKVEEQITLDHGEQRRLQKAISAKVYAETRDRDRRKELFAELYREIRDRFGVASYRDVKRKDMLAAVRYIEAWVPRKGGETA
ncbi:BRO family protein [Ectobacillus ponti]|uniref:BRO family protein n=1 Tax=Ectobacillus ponti TaxID=2961894 RepID=A0AA42BQQ9_9BACI|nr:BRO family protein [Ectobacillus ponti]MCP8970540.1 BRO family protein [Ectobacillus ponti]